jgi:WD40 repeat protein
MGSDAVSTSLNLTAIRKIDAGEPIFAAHSFGETIALILGEAILLVCHAGEKRCEPHSGAILASCANQRGLLTGGDDGKVVLTNPLGASRTIAADAKRRWIDHVAFGNDAVAWSSGRHVFLTRAAGENYNIEVPGSVGGLALVSSSPRVVVAHNNGLTLWSPTEDNSVQTWAGPGANATPVVSPEGDLVATALHEPGMRLWRLSDGAMMPLSGYTERVRSFTWTVDGAYLATSGAERVILWPAPEAGSRLYAVPLLVAPSRAPSVAVAAHPREAFIAAGYADGLVLLVRLTDAAELVMKHPDGSSVSALLWTAAGALAIASENGSARVIEFG